jgi:L-ascorbate 6-phosphate lactonase
MADLATEIATVQVPQGQLAIFWLGGASFAFKTASGKTVAIDPYLSDALEHYYGWKRLPLSPIPLHPDQLAADLILVTHAHEDHLDPEAIPELAASSRAPIAGPVMCVAAMREWGVPAEQIVEINRGERRVVAGIDVRAVLAHHVSPAGAQTPDAVGYVLDLDGCIVYHTGDSLYHDDLRRALPDGVRPQVLLVCINGGYGNMNPGEAARLASEVDPAAVIPMHWGLVAENTADPSEFVAALAATGSKARPIVMLPGDLYLSSFARI